MVDSHNKDRIPEAYSELAKLVQEKELREASLLVLANKQVNLLEVDLSFFFNSSSLLTHSLFWSSCFQNMA